MSQKLLEEITADQLKNRAGFKVGDYVRVHTKIKEGDKERIQIFAGIIIAHRGRGIAEVINVRRIASGEGVERIFPVNSPFIEKIEVERTSVSRRARLYYLRDRVGKGAMEVKVVGRGGE